MTGLSNSATWFAWLSASFALSCAFTALALRYARHANVLDMPGQRRSHRVPTPRGGGIGVVLCVLVGLAALPWLVPGAALPLRLIVAVGLIGAVGWIDDHRPLPAGLRFLVHVAAVGVWLMPVFAAIFFPSKLVSEQLDSSLIEGLGMLLLLFFVGVWSINLHNFMDGIDGLLALQGLFVLAALALLARHDPTSTHAFQFALWAAAIVGFVPFNFPRARIFMGDVGSGVIGLLVAAAVIWETADPRVVEATGLIAVSAFLTDATCTLLSRMLSGRRWYRAHREHLYQWMARSGMSHARVVAWYMGWNLLVVAPVLWWINRPPPVQSAAVDAGYGWAAAVYAVAAALWICGKRWCLARVRARASHATSGPGALHASA